MTICDLVDKIKWWVSPKFRTNSEIEKLTIKNASLMKEISSLQEELKVKTDMIHDFRAMTKSIRDCPHSKVKEHHLTQIDNLLDRKFRKLSD